MDAACGARNGVIVTCMSSVKQISSRISGWRGLCLSLMLVFVCGSHLVMNVDLEISAVYTAIKQSDLGHMEGKENQIQTT